VQIGIFLPHQLPRPWSEGAERDVFLQSLEQGELADRLGIDFAWGQEHHFLEEYAHSSAPEVYLAALSQRTKRIRIGHGVVMMPPRFNPPARIAERIATLDLVSGGRVEWGTGESGTRVELEGFGVDPAEKRAMWAESVRETARMLAANPYPGYEGRFFSMPARNVVPKPMQRPHPPLWVACSSREAVRHAARHGMGALTFSFMDAAEARYWVEEYYETFKHECVPIGRSVNPNIAMLTNFMCHRDRDVAAERGLPGARFFAFGLAHYYRDGAHVPGETDLWERFQRAEAAGAQPHAGTGGIGDPESVRAHFEAFEEAGVDQLILLQQAGGYQHEHVCESLSLFGAEVLPRIRERHEQRARRKAERLAPYIERALAKIPPIEAPGRSIAVEAYPLLAKGRSAQDPPAEERGYERRDGLRDFVAPRGAAEQKIAGIFRDALRIDRVGSTDPFFELGGDSILAGEVIHRIESGFAVRLDLGAAFASFTVESLAAQIERPGAAQSRPARISPATPAPSDPEILHEDDRFTCKRLGPGDVEGAISTLTEAFLREPMGRASGIGPEDFEPIARFFCEKAAREGLSLVIVDRLRGTVAACGISEDYAESLRGDPPPMSPKMAAIFEVLGTLDAAYAARGPIEPGAIFHMNMAAVRHDYEARQLGQRLIELSLHLGEERGYRRAIGHIAAAPLQELFVRHYGFEEIARVDYATFTHEGERVFASIESPRGTLLLERALGGWRSSRYS
jgi:alkanesulfonate monooxygenase SsuD/methylene tetrahydromethanopterin reductase-like flavin-dependent oxidoreductase (luciferase family)/acyl carrier protein